MPARAARIRTARIRAARLQAALVAACLLAAPCTLNLEAATIRGKAACAQVGHSPAALLTVTVYGRDIGQSKPATMSPDGTFYLYNVPRGSFSLQLWLRANPNQAPKAFQITVTEPYTQVPPVTGPC